MVRVLLPSELIDFWTAALAPVPAATRMMTAATPMMIPDIVSSERSLFASTPRTANRALSRTFTTRRRAGEASRRRPERTGHAHVGPHAPVAHAHHPLGVLGDLLLVGDHDERAARRVQVVEQVQHARGAGAVERAGGLVGQQQHRVRDDRARDRHALLLAARQLRRVVARPGAEPDQLQRGQRPPPALRGPDPGVGQRQLDVAERGGARDEVERLEHEPDLAVADGRLPLLVEPPDVDAVEQVAAAAWAGRGSR